MKMQAWTCRLQYIVMRGLVRKKIVCSYRKNDSAKHFHHTPPHPHPEIPAPAMMAFDISWSKPKGRERGKNQFEIIFVCEIWMFLSLRLHPELLSSVSRCRAALLPRQ